jgi:hypothetical protein
LTPFASTQAQSAAAGDNLLGYAPLDIDRGEEARLYAAMYPDRVARIRAAGGLPTHLDFGPPAPDVDAALLRGPYSVKTSQLA